MFTVISSLSFSQILDVSPAFPTVNDVVTIVYDATEGNAALIGQTQIYCHTGIISSTSTSPTNWQFVQGVWGTADAEVLMTNLGNNKHSITIDIDQFYGFPGTTNVLKLAFVFRNSAGSIVGRSADGSDIYYDIYPVSSTLLGQFFDPQPNSIVNLNSTLPIVAECNTPANLMLRENGTVITSLTNSTVLNYSLVATTTGTNLLEFVVNDGTNEIIDSLYYTVNPTVIPLDPPTGLKNGINYLTDSTVILQLYAPEKQHVYVLGDFNGWQTNVNYHMNLSTDLKTWWIEIGDLTPGQRYGYQYFIDGTLKIADPLSTLILDKNNDASIGALTNPNPHPYPTGLTTGFVTIMQPGAPEYNWQNDGYSAPQNKDLVIYELLVRDFVQKRNYQTLIDSINYLDKLGINAIHVMPPGEFENNESDRKLIPDEQATNITVNQKMSIFNKLSGTFTGNKLVNAQYKNEEDIDSE